MNKTKTVKYAAGITGALLLVVMIGITIVEKASGADYVHKELYASPAFLLLWFLFALFSCIYILQRKLYRRGVVFMIHASLLVILTGALCTWFFSERGIIRIEKGQSKTVFLDDDGNSHQLPFSITLDDFFIDYYKGTPTPMDYTSKVSVTRSGGIVEEGVISMNNICSFDNYRFYQTGYDKDYSVLSVSHDPLGITVTYAGYLMLLVSVIMFLFVKGSRFRVLINRVSDRGFRLMLVLAFAICSSNISADNKNMPQVLPENVASEFGDLYIYYNGRVCPMQTFARDFTRKIYGSDTYRGFTSEQVLSGWIFYYDSWKEVPFIKIKSSRVKEIMGLGDDYASLQDFFTSQNQYCLEESLKHIRKGEDAADSRGIIEADEKFVIISQAVTGASLKIFPHVMSPSAALSWYSQVEHLPSDLDHKEWVFVRKSLDYLNEKILMQNWDDALHVIDKIKQYQVKKSGGMLPSESKIKAEKIYNKIEYTRVLTIIVMTLGLLLLVVLCLSLVKNRSMSRKTMAAADCLVVAAWAYLSGIMYLRYNISGHLPLSNGYETMQFMAWCTLLLTFVFRNRFILIRPFGLLITGFALIVSMLGISNPQITPLMPVLSSPLLSIHVMVIMIAYALLSFVMLNGIMALVLYKAREKDTLVLKSFQDISELLLYPAVFLLAIGIFIGAVWANVSWGRYWGWDPKETWALVTMLIYAAALHRDSFVWFRKPIFFHVYCIVAFVSVLMTYFGVNFILGGMHSYA